jgi:hypothetical protein
MLDKTSCKYCLGHFELASFPLMAGVIQEHGMNPSILSKFDRVLSGHYHCKSSSGNITYLGTQYQLTWADYGEEKGFHVFDDSSNMLKFIKNPNTVFYKIVYDEDMVYTDEWFGQFKDKFVKVLVNTFKYKDKFESFKTNIENSNVHDLQILYNTTDATSDIDMTDIDDTLKLMTTYIDNNEYSVNVNDLKSVITTLYTKALSDTIDT